MKKEQWRQRFYGIQSKFLINFVLLLLCTALPITILILGYAQKSLRTSFAETYTYRNKQVLDSFLNYYEKVDADMGQFVLNASVQNSLKNGDKTMEEREAVSKVLAYMGEHSDYYLYVDNKGKIYSPKNISLSKTFLKQYEMFRDLEKDYAKTKLSFCEDELFGGEGKYLFASRYVRPISYNYSPGILCLRLNFDELDQTIEEFQDDEAYYIILDQKDTICYVKNSSETKTDSELYENIQNHIASLDIGKKQFIEFYHGDLYSCTNDENTGFKVAVYVPRTIVLKETRKIESGLLLVCLCVLFMAFFVSTRLAKRLTSPIKEISHNMKEFDETKLGNYLEIQTDTELDIIGNSYNHMIDRVSGLLDEVKRKEQELRESEMESLVYQIQPHFLYNTLDAIYMLARFSKETKIMNMIDSLSKMLRINLSQGEEEIPIEKELEHVKAYMEIQKIRNDDLFEYEIICDEAARKISVIKMILQPLAENCIKHGFKHILDGGHIRIQVKLLEDNISITVSNDGDLIEQDRIDIMNQLEHIPLEEFVKILPQEEGGYGIRNVVKRLRLRYGDHIRFYYEAEDGWTVCHMEIPVHGGKQI